MPSGWTRVLRALPLVVCVTVLAPHPAFAETPDEAPVATTVPAAPGDLVVAPAAGRLDVSWSAPAADGGSPVREYEVTATAPNEPVASVLVATTATPLDGLKNGVTYAVRVVALNGNGPGDAVESAGTPRTVPGIPKVTGITAGDRYALVTWSAPGNGGAAITAYDVTASTTGRVTTVAGTATRAKVTGLVNGTAVGFTVTAVNAAGAGAPSPLSVKVVPRQPVKMTVVAQPAATVRYGYPSSVRAEVRAASGNVVPGMQVELWGKARSAASYSRMAVGTTGDTGRVTLRATLRSNTSLQLRHPLGAMSAPDTAVRPVAVAPKVGAVSSDTSIRIGQSITVKGSIAPAHPVGSTVRLQRHSSDGWLTVASGRMTSTTAYRIAWKPARVGTYSLRVVKPADSDHALGKSIAWSQRVSPPSAVDIARTIANDAGITLERTHDSGISDLAHARQNIVDVAGGGLARRSAYQNAPGGYTSLDLRLLKALRRMGELGRVTVSEIAGGSHSRGSTHYYGRGLDISWVNGQHVGPGSSYRMAVDVCRAYGAVRVFSPGYDPYGGHSHHVHCDW